MQRHLQTFQHHWEQSEPGQERKLLSSPVCFIYPVQTRLKEKVPCRARVQHFGSYFHIKMPFIRNGNRAVECHDS